VSVYRSGKLIYALIWATHYRNDVLLKPIYANSGNENQQP